MWVNIDRTYVRSLEKGATRETCLSIFYFMYIYILICISFIGLQQKHALTRVDCLLRAQRPVSIIESMSLNKHMFESRKSDLAHQLETLETIMPWCHIGILLYFPKNWGLKNLPGTPNSNGLSWFCLCKWPQLSPVDAESDQKKSNDSGFPAFCPPTPRSACALDLREKSAWRWKDSCAVAWAMQLFREIHKVIRYRYGNPLL